MTSRYLGLDLGGTNIKFAVVEFSDFKWTVISTDQTPTQAVNGPAHVVSRLAELAGKHSTGVDGVGVAVPGIFDADKGTILLFPNLPGPWKDFQIVDPIQKASSKPVGIINDARAFSLAEAVMGAAKGKKTVACLVLGTGVGGGIIIDGKVHMGSTQGAGEIAHQIVKYDGPLCGCGARGCAEPLTSSAAISQMAGTSSPEEAYKNALAGDQRAIHAFEEVGKWLGIAMTNVMAVVSPDVFVIGGGVAQSGDLVLNSMRKQMEERMHLWPTSVIHIVPATLGVYAGAIGAALNGAIVAGAQLSLISTT